MLYYDQQVISMKIKYNLEYNYLNIYDETQGIVSNKHLIYRDEGRNIESYTKSGFKFIKFALIELVFLIIFNILPLPRVFVKVLNFIFSITVGGIVAYYVVFFSLYTTERNRSHKGEIEINEDGVLDVSEDGVKIGIPWHYIECVIITEKVICFMSRVIACISITSDHADEVLEAIEKYQDDLKIIDKRYKRKLYKFEEEKDIDKDSNEDTSTEEKEEDTPVKEDKKIINDDEKVELENDNSKRPHRRRKKEDIDEKIKDVEKAIEELTKD